MTAAQLIERLKKVDPEAVVLKFGPGPDYGFFEVLVTDGTHTAFPGSDGEFVKANRAKWVKGEAKPEYVSRNRGSKAKPVKFVVLY